MVTVENKYSQNLLKSNYRISWLRNNIGTSLLIILLITDLLLYDTIFKYKNFLNFSLFTIFPFIPLVYLENKWRKNIKSNNENTSYMNNIIRNYRVIFIISGVIFSIIVIFISIILEFLVINNNNFAENNYPAILKLSYLTLFLIATYLVGIFISASFYRIRAENPDTGKRYNFFSSPIQISTLIVYVFSTSYLGIWILWIGYNILFDYSIFQLLYQTFTFIIIVNTAIFFSIIANSKFIPYIINDANYRPPKQSILFNWIMNFIIYLVLSILASYYFIQFFNIFSDSNKIFYENIIFISIPILFIFELSKQKISGKLCPQCNLILNSSNLCNACENREKKAIKFKLFLNKKVKHPTCPSCGNIWDNLSRKCIYCGFTIVLSCEKCSQTLNPLWRRCNHCGQERLTIPEIAMQPPGSVGFTRSQALLRVVIAILIPLFIIQITSSVKLFNDIKIGAQPQDYSYIVVNDFTKAVFLLVTILSGIILLLLSSIDKNKSISIVINKILFSPGTSLMIATILMLLFNSFTKLNNGELIGNLLVLIVSIIISIFSFWGYYKSLLSFRPIQPFNPKFILDRIEEVI